MQIPTQKPIKLSRAGLVTALALLLSCFSIGAHAEHNIAAGRPLAAAMSAAPGVSQTQAIEAPASTETAASAETAEEAASQPSKHGGEHGHAAHGKPAWWSVIPFVSLLLMIATGPLFFEHFWHKYYPHISVSLGVLVVAYYLFGLGNTHGPVHALSEYLSFIALLGSLFVAAGGILIKIDRKGTPEANTTLLVVGAAIANLIGTTGASMLLIRPFMRLNGKRITPMHVVFFIFMVSNVGGCLTPIGDPPLFLGFLKGIPFFWTASQLWPKWIFAIGLLAATFYVLDKRSLKKYEAALERRRAKKRKQKEKQMAAAGGNGVENGNDAAPAAEAGAKAKGRKQSEPSGEIAIRGQKNFLWLAGVMLAVFIDPAIPGMEWVPALKLGGVQMSFVRETIMIGIAVGSYLTANKECLKGNEFNFEPIREVGFVFIGIFGTMIPALEMVGDFAKSPSGKEVINTNTLYFATGFLSSFLDNAPTYLNFLAAAMSKYGFDINQIEEVRQFVDERVPSLVAISVSAVFFGAMTYIGNGPNFMVKAIAEQNGVSMPSFFGYMLRYAMVFLMPILLLTWLVFIL
jgi:Na+/H+ antiporter NhaD/arsenite permease-like protein